VRAAGLERPAESAAAFYQHAEICRVRGDFDAAEEGYRQASRAGRRPQPGLALLRLAQGDAAAADAAIRSALHETKGQRARAQVLHAAVDILLASADVAAARAAAGELDELARRVGAPPCAPRRRRRPARSRSRPERRATPWAFCARPGTCGRTCRRRTKWRASAR
jgi:hypothetical protein